MRSTIGAALVVLLAALVVAGPASATHNKTGGTLNVDLTTDVDYTDPALSYLSTGWELEYATCLKLVNYPDANGPTREPAVPEAASGFPKVSKDGKTYDFTVNASFTKFSNGQPVTAGSFKAALDRDADPAMQSPSGAFISDIVGADKSPISGVRVKGNHLLITMQHASPDLLARLAMPFFCAIPASLPHDPNGVATPPSAGPYYVASRTVNKSIVLKRNPYYKGKRPHNADQIVYTIGNSLDATYLRVQQGATDYAAGGIPPASYAEAAQKYGINKGQFWVKPLLSTAYLRSIRPAVCSRTTSRCGRPSTRRSTGKRCSCSRVPGRQAHGSDPASWHGRLPRRGSLPAEGTEPEGGSEAGSGSHR